MNGKCTTQDQNYSAVLVRFLDKIEKTETCWIWKAGLYKNGYGQFWKDGRQKSAHRCAFEIFKGNIRDGMCVCHTCDNPRCVNPEHLFLGSHKDNSQDASIKNRTCKFDKNKWGKLTKDQSLECFRLYESGRSQTEIAKKFNIHQATVWKHLRKYIPSLGKLEGEKNNNSKLTTEQILSIRKEYVPFKNSCKKLSIKYGVHLDTIERIIKKKTWKCVS